MKTEVFDRIGEVINIGDLIIYDESNSLLFAIVDDLEIIDTIHVELTLSHLHIDYYNKKQINDFFNADDKRLFIASKTKKSFIKNGKSNIKKILILRKKF